MESKLTDARIRLTFIIAFLIMCVFLLLTFINMRKAETASGDVKASLDLLLRLESTIIDLNGMHAAQTGFSISGDEKFLQPFYDNLNRIRRDTTFLAQPYLYDEETIYLKTELLQKLNAQITHSKQNVEIRKLYGADSARVHMKIGRGDEQFLNIGSFIDNIKKFKRSSLEQTNTKLKQYARRITGEFFILVVLFFGILYYSLKTINREFHIWEENEQSLRFNASVIQNISDPIITLDNKRFITNWNNQAENLYGYKENEVTGKKINEVLKSEYPQQIESIDAQIQKTGSWKGEMVHYTKDGEKLFVEVSTSGIKNEDGETLGTVQVIRNITERKRLQNELQNLNQNLEQQVNAKAAELTSVFERITDAFIALDNNWNYTYINKKAEEMHGKPASEMLGKNIWEQFPDVVLEPFYDALQTAKETQLPQRLQLYFSKTGRWFEDLIYPTEDGISVYYHDITEKRKADLALEQIHEKLSFHINNTPMGVIEFDSNLNILQWNQQAEKIFGWTAQEIVENNIAVERLVYKEDILLVDEVIHDLMYKNIINNVVTNRNNTKDGHVIMCEWYNSVLKDESGKVIGIMSLVLDVTARKKVEAELQEAEAKFRNLVEQTVIGVYILQNDEFVYTNPRFAEIFGYEPTEPLETFTKNILYPQNQDSILRHIHTIREKEKETLNFDTKIKTKAGYDIDIEANCTYTIYKGKPAIIGTFIDISERKRNLELLQASEQALTVSNERFLLVSKATNDAVWDWNLDTDMIWGNESYCKLLGVNNSDGLQFQNFIDRLHPDDREKVIENFRQAIQRHDRIISEEFRMLNDKGDYLTVYDQAYVLYDAQNKGYRMLGAMQDITELRKSARQLTMEKELSDSIINSLPGLFYLFNKNGKLLRWNRNLISITGYSNEEVESKSVLDFLIDKNYAQYKIEEAFREGEASLETGLIIKSGTSIPYYFNASVTNYEGEECLLGVGIDISERVLSQKRLKQSEENFRTLIEQASDGIFICNNDMIFLDVNSSATKLSGYTKEELIGMNMFDILEKADENSPEAINLDELKKGNVIIKERKIKTKDGQVKDVEISAKLLIDGRFQGIVRDITSRKLAAEELKISENKYRLLFNQNPLPMWMLNKNDKSFIDVNQAAINFYGYSKEAFLHMREQDLQAGLVQAGNEERSSHDSISIWQHRKKDGSLVKVNILEHTIYYEGQEAILVLANDITDKLKAEENLKKSHEELRQLAIHLENIREEERTHMAREIHDELGQQLTGLKMDISWISKKIFTEDNDVIEKIQDTIRLIDGTIITVRRIATQLRPSILDDLGLVAAMEWQSEEFEKRAEIKTHFTSAAISQQVDAHIATAVFRIFQESLTNVLRHSGATEVKAFLEINQAYLQLKIQDNGMGFLLNEIENKKTLGLLGMKERVTLLGGTYEITSEPGQGTLVRIIVPLKHREPSIN